MFRLYRHYKNGFLPVSGGILDQTNPFLQAMEIVESAVAEYEERRAAAGNAASR
ncbi:MAG: hypothetical protein HZA02_04600 [Nitrospinae bacterium]|nr:hypothetical protein [Nitrospinota bacterium]